MSDTEALEAARSHAVQLFELAPLPHLVFSQDQLVVELNLAAVELLGVGREALLGKPLTAFVMEKDRIALGQHLDAVFGTASLQRCELGLQAGGIALTALLESRRLPGAPGEPMRSLTTVVNLTRIRRLEERIGLLGECIERIQDVVIITEIPPEGDGEPRIVFANKAFETMTGYRAQDVILRPLSILHGPQTDPEVLAAINSAMREGVSTRQEMINHAVDGRPYWVEMTAVPIRGADGRVTHHAHIQRDISDRKQREQSLGRLNQLLATTMDALPAQIALIDSAGTVISANTAWRSADESTSLVVSASAPGDNFLTALAASTGTEQGIARRLYNSISLVLGGVEARADLEFSIVRNGVVRWWRAIASPLRESGRNGAVLMFLDSSEKHRAQEAIVQANRHLGLAQRVAGITTLNWCFNGGSSRPEELEREGMSAGTGLSYAAWRKLVHPDDVEHFDKSLTEAMQAGSEWETEFRTSDASHGTRWMLARGVFDKGGDRTTRRLLGACMDITVLKKLEQSRNEEERRFRALMERSTDGIALMGADDSISDVTGACERILGMSRGELLGGGCREHLHPEDRPRFDGAIGEARRSGEQSGPVRCRLQQADGTWRWLEFLFTDLSRDPAIGAVVINFRDVTTQVSHEVELRESRAFLEKAQEVARIGSWKSGFGGPDDFLVWSPSVFEIFGINPEAFNGKVRTFTDRVHPDDLDAILAEGRRCALEGGSYSVDHRIILPNGETRWINEHADVQYDSQGRPEMMIGIVQDITDRVLAAEALRKANEELEHKVEERTRELRSQSIRQSALASLELAINKPHELQGVLDRIVQLVSELLPATGGASVFLWDTAQETFTLTSSTVPGQEKSLLRSAVRASGGATRWIVDNKSALIVPNIEHDPFVANPMLRERRLNAYAGMPLMMGGEVLGVLYALDSEVRHYTQSDLDFLAAMAERAAVTIAKVRLSEDLVRTNDQLAAEARMRERAQLELARAKESADAARDEAHRANQAKSEFLSRMSHELRTPLNAILGFAQLLEMQSSDAGDRESIKHIIDGGQHLLTLINEVLDIARIETGRVSISPEAIQIRDILRESLDLLRPEVERRGIRVDWRSEDLESVWVTADPNRLRQVFINLLSNAIKYNRAGGTVTLRCEETAANMVALSFEDTGVGIPAEKMERLFTPFDRLGKEASGIEGSGLGLALSQRLVEVMKGTLSLKSDPEKGTTATLILRRAEPPAIVQDESESELGAALREELDADREVTILYIEDNLANVTLIKRIMDAVGSVTLLSAPDAEAGLKLAMDRRPDLILLDLHLPDMSGATVLERIRLARETKSIPVIIVSADATSGQVERLTAAGANAYITKPYNIGSLLRQIGDLLRSQASGRAQM